MLTIPFTHDSVRAELADQPLVVYRNELPLTEYKRIGEIILHTDGDVSGSPGFTGWECGGGILFLLEQGKVSHRIDSLEVTNNTVHAMGESLREANSMYSKLVLSVKKAPTFDIVISSHVDYYQQTVPRLLKSLKRVGYAGDALVVVSDLAKRPAPLEMLDAPGLEGMGITLRQVGYDKYGYTALLEARLQADYTLLLHDTCEAVKAFPEGVADIDVGLNPDFILLAPNVDMGFYSSAFISTVKEMVKQLRPDKIRRELKNQANLWVRGPRAQQLTSKDVYGGGVKREVHLMDIGIKKYVQSKLDGAQP